MNELQIQELLRQRADAQARLKLLAYDGTPEVKEKDGRRYLYVRKRVDCVLSTKKVLIQYRKLSLIINKKNEKRNTRKKSPGIPNF